GERDAGLGRECWGWVKVRVVSRTPPCHSVVCIDAPGGLRGESFFGATERKLPYVCYKYPPWIGSALAHVTHCIAVALCCAVHRAVLCEPWLGSPAMGWNQRLPRAVFFLPVRTLEWHGTVQYSTE
ncbi:unnamed protein product, partial [Discosporangium mesarthrocarpum]